ncbi:MAG: hypothetical protein CSA60_01315 [Neptuniibacter caesariensis]|uniref:DUF1778 domain-containing protein n=1 Tax=Neptuniibacter caesariensis TaxID=207954 RepID=A0A2G6JRJ8_NEPCE|nr:MAG: hypothetical protein CSA60_01315 [Neptuniibacter caesariensis]
MPAATPKDARLVARVPQDVQEFVKNAADLSGATLSQFIVEAVTTKARSVYESEQSIRLSMQGAEAVFAALENPPPINNKLLNAAKALNANGGLNYADDSST